MAESARIHEPERATPEAPPALQLVHSRTGAEAQGEAALPNVGRSAAIGYLVGLIAATVAITVAGTLSGLGFGASLGLGVFVGIWGGGGFGFMMGGSMPLARHLDAQAARSTDRGRGDG